MRQVGATAASAPLGWPHHPSAGKLLGKFTIIDILF